MTLRTAAGLLPVALLTLLAPVSRGSTVTFSDDFELPTVIWTNTVINGTGTVARLTTGGDPDGYQETTFTSAGEINSVMNLATYDPSQGQILDLSMGFNYLS